MNILDGCWLMSFLGDGFPTTTSSTRQLLLLFNFLKIVLFIIIPLSAKKKVSTLYSIVILCNVADGYVFKKKFIQMSLLRFMI